ncbi:MAG TPA: RNA polymerase sigma factor [Pyrinomonadaceae bacterium]|nr:RNA polymerase sigma factor [Pyrinomonadaceae bacterium]
MTVNKTPSDDQLLRLVMAGDEDAFTSLYRRRQGGVYRFALHMSGSEAVAEDVTQEVFMVLVREANRYDPSRGSLQAYLYGIARNHVLRRLERDRPFVQIADEAEAADAAPAEGFVAQGDPLKDLLRSEMIESVRQAVLALPSHYREVVVLCDLHEMSYVEAASALSCAVGTVRSRLHRARSMLVERLRATQGKSEEPDTDSGLFKTARCFA